ncbi:MAG: hypothetical protein C0453_17960 [Comamonadaceae bacterium]|nr:hypothetical protein [Comamonadaceae bacterium]
MGGMLGFLKVGDGHIEVMARPDIENHSDIFSMSVYTSLLSPLHTFAFGRPAWPGTIIES